MEARCCSVWDQSGQGTLSGVPPPSVGYQSPNPATTEAHAVLVESWTPLQLAVELDYMSCISWELQDEPTRIPRDPDKL